MGMPLFAATVLFTPLRQLARTAGRLFAGPARQIAPVVGVPVALSGAPAAPARPLRVVRVVEAARPASAGRMVISGRMADVCAELERLAALEAAAG